MGRRPQKLELTWFNKDQALIPTEEGKYGYTWVDPKDPRYCETHTLIINDVARGTQAPKEDGITYSERADLDPTDDNLLILGESGDVLEALTRVPELADKYVGQVKCVYIDPPFNTAQTFANYEDNLEHSIWLTMMRDRLIHLRQLLSDDGSIWVHLDDVENHRMRVLMDEIFGAGNYVADITWEKSYGGKNDSSRFINSTDHILVYSKSATSASMNRLPRNANMDARYSNPDNDPRGPWKGDNAYAPGSTTHPGMVYGVQHPITGEMVYPRNGSHWVYGQERMLQIMRGWGDYRLLTPTQESTNRRASLLSTTPDKIDLQIPDIVLPDWTPETAQAGRTRYAEGKWPIYYPTRGGVGGFNLKRYLSDMDRGRPPTTLFGWNEVGNSDAAKKEIKALFPDKSPFATPKPERFLERIIHIATDPGDVVLDVFAGSGTTAAVAHKMGRRWVTCELVEDTMDRFTRPRLEKVVYGEDPGGITLTKGERIDATAEGLPEGISAEDAQKLTSLLNKTISDNDELKKSKDIRALKTLVKTSKSKDTVNWRGGGSFTVARLSPSCFDYDPELDLVTLTQAATGTTLVASVAANLGFYVTPEDRHFDGVLGRQHLSVVEGVLDSDKVDDLMAHLPQGHTVLIAATIVTEGVREYVRGFKNGSRVVNIPLDIFTYTKAQEEN